MALGKLPWIGEGRFKFALVGAFLILITGTIPIEEIIPSLELPTLLTLFVLMLLSAILEQSLFYTYSANILAKLSCSPKWIVFWVVCISGALSAFLANDIVCYAMAPTLCVGLKRRGLDPRPSLFALMGASNAGSAATMIGNPQNILIGTREGLAFWPFFKVCAPIALFALFLVYVSILWVWRKELSKKGKRVEQEVVFVDGTSAGTSFVFLILLIIGFILPYSRAIVSLFIAFFALAFVCSRRSMRVRQVLKDIDWKLLGLFAALFIVNVGFKYTGIVDKGMQYLLLHGVDFTSSTVLAPFSLLTSNTIGNVPAVIFVLQFFPSLDIEAYYILAVMMTFAGNALLLGSLANIIVVERAQECGQECTFWDHMKGGLCMSLSSMGMAWLYFSFINGI